MSVTQITADDLSFGRIRYFQSDRCMNDRSLQNFNRGKIKAKELIAFDSGLMELKETEESEIIKPEKNHQLLAIIMRPATEPDDSLKQKQLFEFCGYDLVEALTCTSAITNCGAMFDEAVDYQSLNQYGLISSYRQAVNTQLDLTEKYPEESHACCEIVEIWRWTAY